MRFSHLVTFALCLLGSLHADVELPRRGKEMRLPTQEEIQKLEQEWTKVVHVRPNKIGRTRSALEAGEHEAELVTSKEIFFGATAAPLPSYVDNSILPSFPPIFDQGREGSCVACASTYYQATHEVGLMNGYNNRVSSAHILSPKWTYNMINGGADRGSFPPDAFNLLAKNGAASLANLPYVAGDILAWDVKTDDWIAAMYNRTSDPNYVAGIGGDAQDLTHIKQLLSNGHVLTFATFIDSWQFTQIKPTSYSSADNRFVGQSAATWMNGRVGGHYMTIVGYDDNLWIDVNGNGQVDPGEMGAFLVANSWGDWGNHGYIWVSYDAFLANSAVSNAPSSGRVALAEALNNYVVCITGKEPNYKPQLVATFGLTSKARSEIGIYAGVSTEAQTKPVQAFQSGALNFQGGAYGFDGRAALGTATFALDLTDLVDLTNPASHRFYFMAKDSAAGNPTTVQSLSLIDYLQGSTTAVPGLPLTIDNQMATIYIDHALPAPSAAPLGAPLVTMTAPLNSATLSGMAPVAATIKGTTAITSVSLYLDEKLISIDKSAPYTFLINSAQYTNGPHTLTVVATDANHTTGSASVTVQIQNGN